MYFILKILYKNFNVEALVLSKKHLAFGLDSLNHVKEKNANKNKGIFKNLYYNYLVSFLLKFRALFSKNKVRLNKSYLVSILDSHIIHYPTPIALTYAWSFGSLAGISLVIQMVSGISLAMHYTPHIDMAFASVEYIMRDVPNGWLIRYIHSNGASMFFMVVYAHICRGIYYGSYMEPRQTIWITGMILFLLMMGTAFTGYVLPWGQMSLWGATVITSMVTVLPVIGLPIAEWIWGGYTIKNPTINRFYVIHFILPFLIVGVTFIHLALLHEVGSNSPIGSDAGVDDVPFYPYFVTKDLFALSCYLFVFAVLVFYCPNALNHPDNYVPANPIETPPHVVPEWYFLPYYAILRSIPHKTGGILAMFGSIAILFTLPYTNTSIVRSTTFRPIFKPLFWLFLANVLLLFWLGQKPVRDHFVALGQVLTISYFILLGILFPISGKIERFLATYKTEE